MEIDLTPRPEFAEQPTDPWVASSEPEALGPNLVTMSRVTPERVSWLWPGRLPLGKLVVIDGDPSTGKSTLCLDIASHVSTGRKWPDGARGTSGDVLLLSAEDGLADTIAPRLQAAGADASRIHALTEVPQFDDDGGVRMVPPSLPRDIPIIRHIIEKHGVKLVVVDVLMAYLNSGVDSHRDQDVRGVLHQLGAVSESTGCTIVLIRHLNKAGGSNALYRGGGSIGIVGAARSAFLVGRDPQDEDRRIFAVTKMNIAAEPPSLAYRLVSDPAAGCARVEWEAGTVDISANALLRVSAEDGDDEDDRNAAQTFILDFLTDRGLEAPAGDVIKAGRAAGFNENEMKNARKRSRSPKVVSRKSGFGASGWVWAIEGGEGVTQTPIGVIGVSPQSPDTYDTYGEIVTPSGDDHEPLLHLNGSGGTRA